MASYTYSLEAAKQYSLDPLVTQCRAAGLPVDFANGSPDAGTITVFTSRDLTGPEQSQLAAIVLTYDGRPRRARKIIDILTDVAALNATQQANVWTDLSSGTPAKLTQDAGPNAASVLVMQFLGASVSGLTNAEKNDGRRRAAAFYCQDNPAYLVRPPFDSTINVAGDEPYTP